MQRTMIGLLSIALAASARGAPAQAPLVLAVALRARAQCHRSKERPLLPNATLHSGDCMMMKLGTNRPAYVYVLQSFPSGPPVVRFPEAGDVQVSPTEPLRLPGGGRWFQLDGAVGAETLVIIASAKPLAQVDAQAAELVRKVRHAESGVPSDGGPPLLMDIHSRSLNEVDADGGTVYARASGEGAALFRITIQHAP